MTTSVVSDLASQRDIGRPAAASSKFDLHACVALGLATLVASGIMTLVVVAYSRVP